MTLLHVDITTLDDLETMELDASGMLDHVTLLGHEFVSAWERASVLQTPSGPFDSVVIAGVGGSAIAGDYFRGLALLSSPVPIEVVRSATLPAYVGDGTLVIACSYSGNTTEALTCYKEARIRGASVLVISSGGEITKRAQTDGFPCWHIDYDSPPRAALGPSLAVILRLGTVLGLLDLEDEDVHRSGATHSGLALEVIGPGIPARDNRGKSLAGELIGRNPLVLAAEHLEPAAVRFCNQLAENGKLMATVGALPEAQHNLIVAMEDHTLGARSALVTFESELNSERIAHSLSGLAQLTGEAGVPVHRIRLSGTSRLTDLLEATAWADLVSCYVGLLGGHDPTPIKPIERLKAQ